MGKRKSSKKPVARRQNEPLCKCCDTGITDADSSHSDHVQVSLLPPREVCQLQDVRPNCPHSSMLTLPQRQAVHVWSFELQGGYDTSPQLSLTQQVCGQKFTSPINSMSRRLPLPPPLLTELQTSRSLWTFTASAYMLIYREHPRL